MPEAVNLGMGIFPLFPRQALHIITQFLFRARNNWVWIIGMNGGNCRGNLIGNHLDR